MSHSRCLTLNSRPFRTQLCQRSGVSPLNPLPLRSQAPSLRPSFPLTDGSNTFEVGPKLRVRSLRSQRFFSDVLALLPPALHYGLEFVSASVQALAQYISGSGTQRFADLVDQVEKVRQ